MKWILGGVVALTLSMWLLGLTFPHVGSPSQLAIVYQGGTPTSSSPVTPTTVPSGTATLLPSSVPTVTYEQMLSVEKDVLETTRSTLGFISTVITIVLAVLGISGLGVGAWLARAADRSDKAIAQVKELEERSKKLLEENNQSLDLVNRMKANIDQVQKDLERAKHDEVSLREEVKRDREELRRSLLYIQIEEYTIDLFGEDERFKRQAKQALMAMIAPERPILARRRSVDALGEYVFTEDDPVVIEHLKKVAEQDPAVSVRRSAQQALERISKRGSPQA